MARLLWKGEALEILEDIGQADGVRSKNRDEIYDRLVSSLEFNKLKMEVRQILQNSRPHLRSVVQPV